MPCFLFLALALMVAQTANLNRYIQLSRRSQTLQRLMYVRTQKVVYIIVKTNKQYLTKKTPKKFAQFKKKSYLCITKRKHNINIQNFTTMTIYFYLPQTPTNRQISEVYSLSIFEKETLTVISEITCVNDIRVIIKTNQEIYSIDILTDIQHELRKIFNICSDR